MKRGTNELEGTGKFDALGIALSTLCAVHCLSVPLLIGFLPLLGLGLLANHDFEYAMMGLIFLVAGYTFYKGFKKHRNPRVFLFMALGIGIFLLLRPFVAESYHSFATILGGSAFVVGHGLNWRWRSLSKAHQCH